MKPTKVLPEGYKVAGDITLEKNKKLLLFLNLLGLPWCVICVIFFGLCCKKLEEEKMRRKGF